MLNLVLLGPPGAGKGTQAAMLAQAYGLAHIDTGRSLREIAEQDTPLGKSARQLMSRGLLLPDEIVAQVMDAKLQELPENQGFLLDGFPRTMEQAQLFEGILERLNRDLSLVIALKASEETVLERLGGRRVCPECGEVYHIKFRPPRQQGICDICQTPFQIREDDRPEAIRQRISLYHRETEPVLRFYKNKGLLREIDANGSASEVFASIKDLLRRQGYRV